MQNVKFSFWLLTQAKIKTKKNCMKKLSFTDDFEAFKPIFFFGLNSTSTLSQIHTVKKNLSSRMIQLYL